MAVLKVALTLELVPTPVAPLAGDVALTVGAATAVAAGWESSWCLLLLHAARETTAASVDAPGEAGDHRDQRDRGDRADANHADHVDEPPEVFAEEIAQADEAGAEEGRAERVEGVEREPGEAAHAQQRRHEREHAGD